MKKVLVVITLVSVLMLAGCLRTGYFSNTTGDLYFKLNFNDLVQGVSPQAETDVNIAKVTVLVTRDGFDDIITDLTVNNNIAVGKVDNLAPGYWHVYTEVFAENNSLIYTGEADANVLAGVEVQVTILFEPINTEEDTGSIGFRIGLNPMPGYKAIEQKLTKVFIDETKNIIYIWDASTNTIGVYDATTLNRVKDIIVPDTPISIDFTYEKDGFLMGYSSGNVFQLDIATESFVQIADVLMEVKKVMAFSPNYIIVQGPDGYYDGLIKTVNKTTGQIISTTDVHYTFSDYTYNEAVNTIYTFRVGVSPGDIHYIKLDSMTGEITATGDSRYHGDYSLGSPLRVINNSSRIVTSSGNIFACSETISEDILYTGNIGYKYVDLVNDESTECLYLLNNYNIYGDDAGKKLVIVDQNSFFTQSTIELIGNPQYVLKDATSIIVISELDGRYYWKEFSKESLGL